MSELLVSGGDIFKIFHLREGYFGYIPFLGNPWCIVSHLNLIEIIFYFYLNFLLLSVMLCGMR